MDQTDRQIVNQQKQDILKFIQILADKIAEYFGQDYFHENISQYYKTELPEIIERNIITYGINVSHDNKLLQQTQINILINEMVTESMDIHMANMDKVDVDCLAKNVKNIIHILKTDVDNFVNTNLGQICENIKNIYSRCRFCGVKRTIDYLANGLDIHGRNGKKTNYKKTCTLCYPYVLPGCDKTEIKLLEVKIFLNKPYHPGKSLKILASKLKIFLLALMLAEKKMKTKIGYFVKELIINEYLTNYEFNIDKFL